MDAILLEEMYRNLYENIHLLEEDRRERIILSTIGTNQRQETRTSPKIDVNTTTGTATTSTMKRKQVPPKQRSNNLSITGGVGYRHGAKTKQCRHEGCTNVWYKGGFCRRHGEKCSHKGCTNVSVKGGVCVQHGAKLKLCSFNGCTSYSQKGGVCRRHGAKLNHCTFEGCSSLSVCLGGVCRRHSAKAKKKYLLQF